MTMQKVSMNELPNNSLVDDVVRVLTQIDAEIDEKDIKAVEHAGGWCTWPELLGVPGICEKRDYFDYGWLCHFVVVGDGWMLTFDRNGQDEYYSQWVFASTKPTKARHAVPKLSNLIQSRYYM